MSDTPKTDAILNLMRTLKRDEQVEVAAFTKRMWKSGLPATDLAMLRSFIDVMREEQRAYLTGDGFDFIYSD